ncbi:hypothetical protein O0235_00175 [Tepidiforma flava]|uniref:Uncharacterized protein n=1 Tax=Tepidiforma flava TaxID=3004094 RepID=A0ABY7M8S0_9CHLR|nr:hypothetical protein [Tepidiforma flava]WBL36086.1 hypothetical protein O0235_00175 [Tepidiforma flava]
MSRRTMPLCTSAFGPFDPSPGNGPAVSDGMTPVHAEAGVACVGIGETAVPVLPAAAAAVGVDPGPLPLPAAGEAAPLLPVPLELPLSLQPTSAIAATPPNSRRAFRRVSCACSVSRSNCRPRSVMS